jgi:hypothetical protein
LKGLDACLGACVEDYEDAVWSHVRDGAGGFAVSVCSCIQGKEKRG